MKKYIIFAACLLFLFIAPFAHAETRRSEFSGSLSRIGAFIIFFAVTWLWRKIKSNALKRKENAIRHELDRQARDAAWLESMNAFSKHGDFSANVKTEKIEYQRAKTEQNFYSENNDAPGDMNDSFDAYSALGVNRNQSNEEIKAAYHSLIKQYHPDQVEQLGPELKDIAEQIAKTLNRAYKIIREERQL